jgi:signal transduction histidine kinase
MDAAVLSATSALFGSLVGGMTSLASTWLTQRFQGQIQQRTTLATKREALYNEFIDEASKRFVDAMTHNVESPEVIILLYASISRMRLTSSRDVIQAAESVMRLVSDMYAAPNLTSQQMYEKAQGGKLDPLAQFGEACRAELGILRV